MELLDKRCVYLIVIVTVTISDACEVCSVLDGRAWIEGRDYMGTNANIVRPDMTKLARSMQKLPMDLICFIN